MGDDFKILLVEDNPSDVELALHAFKKHNLANDVQVARDGEEAIGFLDSPAGDAFHRDVPRLVLLDLKLPKVSGIEVLRWIKSHKTLRKMPVVVLTSSHEDQDIAECYELGVNSYIVKPVDFVQFTDAVGQLGCYWLLLNHPPTKVMSA